MATVTGFTAERMLAIENDTVVAGVVSGDNLILTTRGGAPINAGNVRGEKGETGTSGFPNPTGTFIMGGWETAPEGYLLLVGTTIINGAITYSDLAAIFPSWVSGDDLILPDTTGAVPLGGTTPGIVSGSMTHTLVTAQLPSHQHTGPSHTHTGPSHTHTINHNHSASSGTGSANHTHNIPNHQHPAGGSGSYGFGRRIGVPGSWDILNPGTESTTFHEFPGTTNSGGGGATTASGASHTHPITIVTHSGSSGAGGTGNTGAGGTGLTGATGSGSAVNHTPRNITVRMAVKT